MTRSEKERLESVTATLLAEKKALLARIETLEEPSMQAVPNFPVMSMEEAGALSA